MKILVTGGSGFIGRKLVDTLLQYNAHSLRISSRKKNSSVSESPSVEWVEGDLSPYFDWGSAVEGCQVVIHLAARAHVMNNDLPSSEEFRKVNFDGSLSLARSAVKAGVKRFIFLSSIGVNGNNNLYPYTETDVPSPQGFYALSKWEAEVGLREIAKQTGLELVIIRPTLVYGEGAPGNIARLVKLIKCPIPLPLGAVNNRRSFIGVDNLISLIVVCLDHPAAANELFLAADSEDVSTTKLLRLLSSGLDKSVCLLPIPVSFLKIGFYLTGKRDVAISLLGSLRVDISKARKTLNWYPSLSLEDGLKKVIEHSYD